MFPGEIPGRSRLALLGRRRFPLRAASQERTTLVLLPKSTFFTTVSGQFWQTSFGKGWFQGYGARPYGRWGIWPHGGAAGRVIHPGGRGDGSAGRPVCGERRGCLIKGDSRVTPYKARDFQRCRVCHTRVQEFTFGGQLSKVSVSNVKSGKISPYRTYSASTWIPA